MANSTSSSPSAAVPTQGNTLLFGCPRRNATKATLGGPEAPRPIERTSRYEGLSLYETSDQGAASLPCCFRVRQHHEDQNRGRGAPWPGGGRFFHAPGPTRSLPAASTFDVIRGSVALSVGRRVRKGASGAR